MIRLHRQSTRLGRLYCLHTGSLVFALTLLVGKGWSASLWLFGRRRWLRPLSRIAA